MGVPTIWFLLTLLPLALGRSVVGYNMTLLARAREGVQLGAPGFAAPWASLQAIANAWLSFPLASVVQKTVPSPPGASIHDYNSWPTYYWRCNQVQHPVAISTGFITWAAALPQDHAADEDSLAWPIPGQ